MLEIWLAFLAGLAGSVHCIGMCGGMVAALALAQGEASLGARLTAQLLYNLGRITTYTVLGGVAGALGSSLDLLALRSASQWFLIGANAVVLLVGLASALGWGRLGLSRLEGSGARFLAPALQKLVSAGSPLASYPLGILLGLLPCGLVYAPLLAAAASGGAGRGAATMAALGAGTLPLLFLFGTASSAISAALRATLLRLAGLAIALMGAAGLWRALARSCCH